MTTSIVLRGDNWRIRVLPQIGGGLAECAFDGQTILQPVRQQTRVSSAPVELCYFPLVPFSNRIRNSQLSFEGRTIQLRPNLPDYPHAIHGHGWQAEWRVLQSDPAVCTIGFEHAASENWPWDYRVLQRFAIDANVLAIKLTLRNLSASRMPAGVGFHPFFPRPDSARLLAAARRLWKGAAEEFPSGCIDIPPELDFGRSRPVRDAHGMDHCYSGWSRSAAIEWPDAPYRITLVADERLAHFVLYVPEDRDFFCIEPVSHAVNAFNFPTSNEHAALALEPEQELSATITVRCDESP